MITRGSVYFVNLDPVQGHEQGRQRPVLVLSEDSFNNGPAKLVVILPITSTVRGIPLHVPLSPPEGGLTEASVILCDQVRTVSTSRIGRKMGLVSSKILSDVEDRLRILLKL